MAFLKRMILKTDFDPDEPDQLGMISASFDPPDNANLIGVDWQPGRIAVYWLIQE